MAKKQKLELTWIGKDKRPKLEPRILLEDTTNSYHAKHKITDHDLFDNRLIYGDNLLALKALEQEFTGKIKCVYIDPPFNTGQAFEHYEDGIEHSLWLTLLRERLILIHKLLHKEGTIFIHIDDNELAYLIVLCDEIFGRQNRKFIATFRQASATGHKAINPGCVSIANYVVTYCKDKNHWTPKRLFTKRDRNDRYNNFVLNRKEHHSQWKIITLAQAFADKMKVPVKSAKKAVPDYENKLNDFVVDNAESVVQIAYPDYNAVSAAAREAIDYSKANPDKFHHFEREGYSDFYLIGGQRLLFYSDRLQKIDGEVVAGEPLTNIWDDILSNNLHNEGGISFPKGKKPEALIKRCLDLATDKGDWVLDSFAGSGTTGAVAHKMGRRWILVELGDHCHTHVIPRIKRIIDGEDSTGVSKSLDWKGGGGFRYQYLAPSLITNDKYGQPIINKEYNPAMLAEAMCKLMGFTYEPNPDHYWIHGHSSETDFIYVTTNVLTHDQLKALSEEVGTQRTLFICCKAFKANADVFENLTIRKIPQAVLTKCEWGKDDYSLNVANLQPKPKEKNDSKSPSLLDDIEA